MSILKIKLLEYSNMAGNVNGLVYDTVVLTANKLLLKQQAFVYCRKPHLDVGDGDGGKHSRAQLNALADS